MNLIFWFFVSAFYVGFSFQAKPFKQAAIYKLDENDVNQNWKSFKIKYKKSYRNNTQHDKRKKIFIENLKKINEHNQKFLNGTEYHSLQMNKFADWVINLNLIIFY